MIRFVLAESTRYSQDYPRCSGWQFLGKGAAVARPMVARIVWALPTTNVLWQELATDVFDDRRRDGFSLIWLILAI